MYELKTLPVAQPLQHQTAIFRPLEHRERSAADRVAIEGVALINFRFRNNTHHKQTRKQGIRLAEKKINRIVVNSLDTLDMFKGTAVGRSVGLIENKCVSRNDILRAQL